MAKQESPAPKKRKKDQFISPQNELIHSIRESDYVKNPLVYSQIRGNFSLMQGAIMLAVVKQLQQRINEQLASKMKGVLFSASDLEDGLLCFDISLKDLGVDARRYGMLPEAKDALLKMNMTFHDIDEKSGKSMETSQNIFHSISIPTSTESLTGNSLKFSSGERRTGSIIIRMHNDSAKRVLTLASGYAEHLGNIYRLCKSPRSARLYIYLSSWRKNGSCSVPFLDLKEYFGLLEYNESRTKIVKDVYPLYGNFARDVLRPAQKELGRLAEEGKIEFGFEYEPIYAGISKRGTPKSIHFKLIRSGRGEALISYKRFGNLQADLIKQYSITDEEWNKISSGLNESMLSEIYSELTKIDMLIEKYQPDEVHSYATNLLVRWIKDQQLQGTFDFQEEKAEEEIPNIVPSQPVISAATKRKWNEFLKMVYEVLGEKEYLTYFPYIGPYEYKAKSLTIAVPSKYVYEVIEQQLLPKVIDKFYASFGNGVAIRYCIIDDYRPNL